MILIMIVLFAILFVLQTELRWESLFGSLTGNATSYEMDSEFRNDARDDLHVRKIRYSISGTGFSGDDDFLVILTKSPTSTTSIVENNTFFQLPVRLSMDGVTTAGATFSSTTGGDSYGLGQLILETGESLFVNARSDATAQAVTYNFEIGYEFDD